MKFGRKPEQKIANYLLSNTAKHDLINIAKYSDKQFGTIQSDYYRNRLKQRFLTLSQQPRLYPKVEYIRKGYRRSVCGVHSIYYREENDVIIIERILGAQDIGEIFK